MNLESTDCPRVPSEELRSAVESGLFCQGCGVRIAGRDEHVTAETIFRAGRGVRGGGWRLRGVELRIRAACRRWPWGGFSGCRRRITVYRCKRRICLCPDCTLGDRAACPAACGDLSATATNLQKVLCPLRNCDRADRRCGRRNLAASAPSTAVPHGGGPVLFCGHGGCCGCRIGTGVPENRLSRIAGAARGARPAHPLAGTRPASGRRARSGPRHNVALCAASGRRNGPSAVRG